VCQILSSLASAIHSLSGAFLFERVSGGRILWIASAKLLLHDSWGAPFFRLPFIQAVRNFLGRDSESALVIFPTYVAVLLVKKASIFGMLQRSLLTSLFFMCFSLTWCHLIARILIQQQAHGEREKRMRPAAASEAIRRL
jgi:hypothetical protein